MRSAEFKARNKIEDLEAALEQFREIANTLEARILHSRLEHS